MKLSEYIKELNKLKKEYGNLEVIYAKDEEGNNFHSVNYEPSLCQVENLEEYYLEIVGFNGDPSIDKKDFNAVCIN